MHALMDLLDQASTRWPWHELPNALDIERPVWKTETTAPGEAGRYRLALPLPGAADITITFTATRRIGFDEGGLEILAKGVLCGQVERDFNLWVYVPPSLDGATLEATYKDGVLTLTGQRRTAEALPPIRKITVQTAK